MGHYAKVKSGTVTQVIVADEDYFDGFVDNEPGKWVQTSYNTFGGIHYDPDTRIPDGGVALRKNYAGIGFAYDVERDAFIPPSPFPSWTLDEATCLWEAPTPKPDGDYIWNEETQVWDEVII